MVAVVVNYHTATFLYRLSELLYAEAAIDCVVIANNGDDVDLAGLAGKFANVEIVQFEENLGFGAAVNRVARQFPAEYYLLINPDTLPEPGFAGHLLEGAQKTGALIAGPRFYWDDEKTFRLPPALGYSLKIHFEMQLLQSNSPDARRVSDDWITRHDRFWNAEEPFAETFLSGACLLIKNDRDFFVNGKIFDERFFLYYEDTDLCLSALAQNKTIVAVPKAVVVHYWDQAPSAEKGRLIQESFTQFMLKHYGRIPEVTTTTASLLEMPDIIQIGEISPFTRFSADQDNFQNKLFFEMGLNHHFVPFAQAEMREAYFRIPESLLNHLKPGEYYSRIRNNLNQTLKIWKWKKQE